VREGGRASDVRRAEHAVRAELALSGSPPAGSDVVLGRSGLIAAIAAAGDEDRREGRREEPAEQKRTHHAKRRCKVGACREMCDT
jgi:hypothetical protein